MLHANRPDPPAITINEHQLKHVHKFTYLGGVMSDDASLDAEINRRISRAAGTCKSLSDRCWNRSGLSMSTKLTVYKATVLPTLLYGSETWATLSIHTHRLETFHQQSLTRIMKIKWWQSISNNEVLQRAKSTTIETMLRGNRLRWLGHVSRMKDNCIPTQLLFGELARGTRWNVGRTARRMI